MVVDDEEGTFKREGAVPFNWEIRPGVPKTRPDDPTLPLPPHLRLKPLPPSNPPPPPSSSTYSISDFKTRPDSPFAPPPSSFKPSPDPRFHCSGPLTPYFRSLEKLDSGSASRRWRYVKSLFGSKKKKSSKSGGDSKKSGQESTSSESDNFYESETTFSTSGESSRGSVSTRWSSPKSSLSSSRRGSPLKRNQSDLSSYEKKTIIMMARYRLG
ncbi:unnamed protein product [Cochlearia groenlandica]